MVFEVYFHFAIYWYEYNFFINIFFNHLISISKWDVFWQSYSLGFELPYSKYYLQRIVSFKLVELQIHVVSKSSICDNNF